MCNEAVECYKELHYEKARLEIEREKKDNAQHIKAVQLDVTNHVKVESTLLEIVETFGEPDILIANAGVGCADLFENISYESFDNVMKTNLYGVRNSISALLPAMKKSGGKIVIVASMAGLTGVFGYTAYGTSKFAIVGFAQCLRLELKQYNIDVSLLCPPEVETPLLEEEAKTLPPQTRALKDFSGLMTVKDAGKAVIKSVTGKKFMYVPGIKAKLGFLLTRFLPERLVHATTDAIIRKASG